MKSITSRLMSIILTITILGMGLIAVIGNILAGEAIREQSLGRIGKTTELNAGDLNAWVITQSRYIDAIAAGFSSMREVGPDALLPELIEFTERNPDYFSVYAGYPDGTGVFNDEWEPDYNEWRANERDWYKGAAAQDGVYITELYVDAESGNFCITFSKAFRHNGAFAGVVAIDIFTTVLNDVVNGVSMGQDSRAFLTDGSGNIYAHQNGGYLPTVNKNEDTVFQNIATIDSGRFAGLRGSGILTGESVKMRDSDGVMCYYSAGVIPSSGWILYTSIPVGAVDAPIRRQIIAAVIVFVIVLAAAAALIYLSLRRLIVRPVKSVTEAANLLSRGETGVRLDGHYVGEIAHLADSFRQMEGFNTQQTEWMEHIAAGDLTIDVQARGKSDRIGQAITGMLDHLNEMFVNINHSTHQAASGAKQIANGSQALAQGAVEQTAAIEELSSSISEITGKTNENAGIAREASDLSGYILQNAEKGNRQMDSMMTAVKEINDAGQSISRVIKTIDDIAFQTNILALNAAVEAARAGAHGKGFAVVAEEVRNLASKSAAAAKDTEGLIENSIEKANLGLSIATETAASLKEIVEGINRSVDIVGRIALYSDEEATSIKQINASIDQISQIIQQNSATAEESASASREMSEQSDILEDLMARFKLKETAHTLSKRRREPMPAKQSPDADSGGFGKY